MVDIFNGIHNKINKHQTVRVLANAYISAINTELPSSLHLASYQQ